MFATRQGLSRNSSRETKGSARRGTRGVAKAQSGFEMRQSSPMTQIMVNTLSAVMKFPPLWEMARSSARRRIEDRGKMVGIDINKDLELLGKVDWQARLEAVTNPTLIYPAYYTKPFHAYDNGNLGWQPALEFELVTKAVHADVMDPSKTKLDVHGDFNMRNEFCRLASEVREQWGCGEARDMLDLGCAVGVSTRVLQRTFPHASITGLDASPYFIAHATYLEEKRATSERITFMHALAEDTGLPDSSMDVVAMSLVSHELPTSATMYIMREAYRLLRPSGVFMIMDMDPCSSTAKKILDNPFASAAFKATEPWLTEYITLDMECALLSTGFDKVEVRHNTPSHKTVVALKR